MIGQTVDPTRPDPRNRNPNRASYLPLYVGVFGDNSVKLFQPVITFDGDSNGYIAIMAKDQPRQVPKLEDIRPEVVKAWKKEKAAKLALERAKKLAAEAEKAGLSLKDALAGEAGIDVVETDPFSWLSGPAQIMPTAQRIPLRLTQPEPLIAAGNEFMEAVFDLEPGKIGAVLNHDNSIAYVIRVQHMESMADLRAEFLEMGEFLYRMYGFNQAHVREATDAVVRDLLNASDLEWKRTPDELQPQDDA